MVQKIDFVKLKHLWIKKKLKHFGALLGLAFLLPQESNVWLSVKPLNKLKLQRQNRQR